MSSSARIRLFALLAAGALALATLVGGAEAGAAPTWAPESTAPIKPGVQMLTNGAQCTANFVFKDLNGKVYVGYAAHCAGLGSSSDTDGCTTKSLPLGTKVQFGTGGNLFSDSKVVGTGKLAYSSWLTMQQRRTKDAAKCAYNDFALVLVDKAFRSKVNPTVPVWGGPTGIASTPLKAGDAIYTVGNSSLRSGSASAKTGSVLRVVGGGLGYDIKTGNPGVPGDSGSGFMDARGRAAGVLSTLSVGISLSPISNTMGDLYRELRYAQYYSGIKGLALAKGTRGFSS